MPRRQERRVEGKSLWRWSALVSAAFAVVQCCGGTTNNGDGGDVDATITDAANDIPNADGADVVSTAACGDAGDAALCNVATEYCAVSCAIYPWQSGNSYTCATPADGGAPSCAGDGCGIPVDAGGCPWCDDAGNVIPPPPDGGPWPNCGVCDKAPSTGLVTWITCAGA